MPERSRRILRDRQSLLVFRVFVALVLLVFFVLPMTKMIAPAAARTIFQAAIPKNVAPLALTARAAAATRPPSAFCIWQSSISSFELRKKTLIKRRREAETTLIR